MTPPGPRPSSIASRTLLVAAALVVLTVAVVAYLTFAPVEGGEEEAPGPSGGEPVAPAPGLAPSARPAPVPSSVPSARLPTAPEPEPPPPAGEATGLAAFPPPGTKPIKRGIVVPEGFPLPEGYVRHYQATDDGQMLPAVLMFHPDFTPQGPDGRPLEIPEDRLVPPELAPPGMPVVILQLPPGAKQ